MGAPEILAKALFAAHTAAITGGACTWQQPAEINLGPVLPDGFLTVLDSKPLQSLPAPWCLFPEGEVVLELKMPGDHMDHEQWLRALLRRAARDVERHLTAPPDSRPLHEALCLVSPHLPDWLTASPMAITVEAPGCHRVQAGLNPVWWITANDLPLEEALLPFLLARSGKHRVELAQWLSHKRDFSTVREMIRVFRMNKVNLQDYLRYEKEDEEAGDRALREFLEAGLEAFPDIADKIRREAQEEAQRAVREASLRAVLQILRVRFGADEAAWTPRLASLDEDALQALHLRALQVSDEAELLP
jgi:hypothetical protein